MGQKELFRPGYLELHESGELGVRIVAARQNLEECNLCPRKCSVDRLHGELGFCRTGGQAVVSSYSPHFGEEAPLVGSGGSGTIFISNCNLLCIFCQNYEISHSGDGVDVTDGQFAAMMVSLQKQGCHNINFVTPSHIVPQILAALPIAIENGLSLPLVYNTSGYDSVETLRLLDGVVDIYMPDFKFWKKESAKRYLMAPDYPERARDAILEMHRQVGDLVIGKDGIARRGLLVRHLVMPGSLAETRDILQFIASKISPQTYVNVMEQYRPCGMAHKYPPINRPLSHEEYMEALEIAGREGVTRLDDRNIGRLLRYLGLT
jgi:putative pyruvate formate lyase activating enzyme